MCYSSEKKREDAVQPSAETTAQDLNASIYASKNIKIIRTKMPKDWTTCGLVILCIDSVVDKPTESMTQWMMEIVNRCNMNCNYTAMICDSKPGVVMVGSATAGIKDAIYDERVKTPTIGRVALDGSNQVSLDVNACNF